jgi:hypothetical protein
MQIREGDNGVFVSGVKDVGSNYLLYYAPSPPKPSTTFLSEKLCYLDHPSSLLVRIIGRG